MECLQSKLHFGTVYISLRPFERPTKRATKLLAEKLIEVADSGERDPDRIYQMAMDSVKRSPDPPRRDVA